MTYATAEATVHNDGNWPPGMMAVSRADGGVLWFIFCWVLMKHIAVCLELRRGPGSSGGVIRKTSAACRQKTKRDVAGNSKGVKNGEIWVVNDTGHLLSFSLCKPNQIGLSQSSLPLLSNSNSTQPWHIQQTLTCNIQIRHYGMSPSQELCSPGSGADRRRGETARRPKGTRHTRSSKPVNLEDAFESFKCHSEIHFDS